MLCSARELGLGSDHSGILVLPRTRRWACPTARSPASSTTSCSTSTSPATAPTPSATSVSPAIWPPSLGLPFTPPRPALLPLRRPGRRHRGDRRGGALWPVHPDGPLRASRSAPARRGWPPGCGRPSGQRPINNVVDVSNYVMLELNQPNHAYDLATLGGGGIACAGRRRRAAHHPRRVERTLTADELLICDAHDVPIGLAGIMGGEHTEIGAATTRWPSSSPGSSRSGSPPGSPAPGLRSDASARWERGVDPYGIDTSIARFVELLGETCPSSSSTPVPSMPAPSRCRPSHRSTRCG